MTTTRPATRAAAMLVDHPPAVLGLIGRRPGGDTAAGNGGAKRVAE